MLPRPPHPLHRQEVARLRVLESLQAFDAPPDAALDALVRAAARAVDAPAAQLNLVAAQRLWPRATHGAPPQATARAQAPCSQVVAGDAPCAVADLSADERWAAAAWRQRPAGAWLAYVGVPVHVDGLPVATLCAYDSRARAWPPAQLALLQDLAAACGALLQARRPPAGPPHAAVGPGAAAPAARTERLLHTVVDGLPAALALSDRQGRIVLVNESWQREIAPHLGPAPWRWPDVLQQLVAQGCYPDAVGREAAHLAERLVGDAPETPPRAVRWQADGLQLVMDCRLPDGHALHMALDISPCRPNLDALERARREGDAQLGAVLAAVPDLWFVIDAQDRYARCAAPDHPSLAYRFDEVVGQPFAAELGDEVRLPIQAALRRARTEQRAQRLEYELPVLDGRRRVFEARVTPMADGQMLYLTRDLTEMRQLERDLLLMQRVFEATSSLPIVIADAQQPHRPVVYVNTAFERLSGWPRSMALGRSFDFLVEPSADEADGQAAPTPRQALRRALDHAVEATVLLACRRRDGSTFTDEISIVPVFDAQGHASHHVGVHRDVTERERAAQALHEKQLAEMANRSKTEFLSRWSHEMRTPLNAIIGFAQLLRARSGARLDHVDHILHAGRHLLGLVNDVLDLQRVEAGQLALQPAPVPLAPLLADCVAMLGPLAEARATAQHLMEPHLLTVTADAQRLRQVLLNIGSNAIKYNRPGGQVRWSAQADGAQACRIAIEDTGTGMTADQLARLFQPFERLGRETSAIEGSGLGLLIARRLVEEMGGQVHIRSEPGVGTRVEITLQRAPVGDGASAGPADAMPADAGLATAADAAPAPLKLLYVEDNRINALLFEETMRSQPGYELRVAEDGEEALELVEHWPPDVLVLDANLPGISGHELLLRLRERPGLAHVPAYMCSADAMPADVQRALELGFRAYWTKPLDVSAVMAELRALERELREQVPAGC